MSTTDETASMSGPRIGTQSAPANAAFLSDFL